MALGRTLTGGPRLISSVSSINGPGSYPGGNLVASRTLASGLTMVGAQGIEPCMSSTGGLQPPCAPCTRHPWSPTAPLRVGGGLAGSRTLSSGLPILVPHRTFRGWVEEARGSCVTRIGFLDDGLRVA